MKTNVPVIKPRQQTEYNIDTQRNAASLSRSPSAVSYTHLDVYKRQIMKSRNLRNVETRFIEILRTTLPVGL